MAVGTIRDLANISDRSGLISPWRTKLLPAHFDGKSFHVESGGRETGRAIVLHEFPKSDTPYAEDMGRRAVEFTVRGYIIQYPQNTGSPLYQRDYTIARDQLIERLEAGGSGSLQLPMMTPMNVTCSRVRLTEEERYGGYCVFDMTFVEQGAAPFQPVVDPTEQLIQKSQQLREAVLNAISMARVTPAGPSRRRTNLQITR
jgi:prophage DNA circulation protein